MDGLDWMDWIGLDPAEKPSPLRVPLVLKIPSEMEVAPPR